MKTIRKKSAGWKGAAWLLCLSMLMTAVEPLAVQAEETIDVSSVIASETTEQTASEETKQTVSGDIGEDVLSEIENDTEEETTAGTGGTSEMVSSEIPSQTLPEWTAKIEDNALTLVIKDAEAGLKTGDTWNTRLYVAGKWVGYAEFSGTTCTVTADFKLANMQELADGVYQVVADEYVTSKTTSYFVKRVAIFNVEKKDGLFSFYSVYPDENAAILDELNAKTEAEVANYTNPATIASIQADSYEEVIQTAKDLVKDCRTDEQKIQKIHDWICNNLAYDYKLYKNGGYVGNQLDYAFQNKRAVCAGFATLGTTMFRAAGIPCVYISGVAASSGRFKDTDKGQGHAWNAVYYNGGWHYMDLTWDCNNKYYGDGSSDNVTGKNCGYQYYGIPALRMGVAHKPSEKGAVSYGNTIKGIIVEDTKEKYACGDDISKDYKLYLQTTYRFNTGGDFWGNGGYLTDKLELGKGLGELSGYDMNTPGKQTVTVTYKGFTTTFDIEVVGVEGIRVEPAENAVYVKGDHFIPEYTLYAQMTDGTESQIDVSKSECTDYDITKAGKQTVKVTYQGHETTFDINVLDVAKLAVEPNTDKYYLVGDTFVPDFKLYLVMADDTKTAVSDISKAVCTGYDMSKAGTQTVTVSYKGLQAAYDIRVASISGLKVVPKVTEYKYGTALDKSGNAVYYVLSDGTEVALPAEDLASVKYSGYSRYRTGTQTVTVSYKGYKTTYTVTVTKSGSGTTGTGGTTSGGTTTGKQDGTKKPGSGTTTRDPAKTPAAGTVLTASTGSYKVTKAAATAGEVAYYGPKNKKVTKITIPQTVTIDGITYKVTSIADKACQNCKKLKTVTIGSNIAKIGKSAFSGCKAIRTVTIKTTKLKAKSIGAKAFKGITKKATFKVPKKQKKAYKKIICKKGAHKKAKFK